jgi:hypothetical protein
VLHGDPHTSVVDRLRRIACVAALFDRKAAPDLTTCRTGCRDERPASAAAFGRMETRRSWRHGRSTNAVHDGPAD